MSLARLSGGGEADSAEWPSSRALTKKWLRFLTHSDGHSRVSATAALPMANTSLRGVVIFHPSR